MKKPTKSTVAAAVTAGGLFLATGAGALTLPGQANEKTDDAVKAVPSSVAVVAGSAAADARQDADHRQDEAKDDETDATESSATETETETEAGSDDAATDTHGATVSDFARSTTLEGRDKGQAIADLAKSTPSGDDDDKADTEDAEDKADTEDEAADTDEADDANEAKPAVTGADRAAEAKGGHGDATDD
jgi:hypothetical protein